uniref:Uncharacterized protein n=1 Tax=Ochrobactrum phage ORM_20 TaxID=2985243 RepID=A0A9N6WUZ5_9VIRU|nr:hypothetical protein ORM20_00126 [Ochrobactrum phage ORM_20]
MNYDNGIPTSAILNSQENINGTIVKWSENGRILVYYPSDMKKPKPRPSEAYDYSKTAIKGVLENLRASNGTTTQSPYLGNGFVLIFNIKFFERRRDLHTFDLVDGKIVPGKNHECREYEAKTRNNAKTTKSDIRELPPFLDVDGTYRIHSDGSLEKIRDRTFESSKRYEFPVFTIIPQTETRKRKTNGKNSLPDYAKAA